MRLFVRLHSILRHATVAQLDSSAFFTLGFEMAVPPPQGQMDIPVIVKRFKSYVLSECRDQLMVIMAHSDETKHFGVYVRFAYMHR